MSIFRRIPLTSTENVRDLGGYPLPNGNATAFGKFIRSAYPGGLSPADEALLMEMGITTIIDLRSQEETQQAICHFADKPGFAYHNFHLFDGGRMRHGMDQIPYAYLEIAKCENMSKALRVLANAPGGCLFHCAAGKDRTGTLAAILLLLAGVDETDIVADYMISYVYLERLIATLSALPDVPDYVLQSKPEYMSGFLRLFKEAYGNVTNYLQDTGLTQEEIKKLRGKLLGD